MNSPEGMIVKSKKRDKKKGENKKKRKNMIQKKCWTALFFKGRIADELQ